MNKSELIQSLAEETNLPMEEAVLVVNTFADCMKESVYLFDVSRMEAT